MKCEPTTTNLNPVPQRGCASSCETDSSQPEKSTSAASARYQQATFEDMTNVISSPASAGGLTLCNSQDGPDHVGPDLAPASRFPAPGKDSEPKTQGICGPCSEILSETASPQSCLASRLRRRLGANGSPEYSLIWKEWAIAGQEPICALRASGHRISGKGSTGWRSPDSNKRGGAYTDPQKVMERMEAGHQVNLEDQAVLSGWPSPNVPNGGRSSPQMSATGVMPDGTKRQAGLEHVAKFSGWNTPRATNGENGGPNQAGGALPADAATAGRGTPRVTTNKGNGNPERATDGRARLEDQVMGVAGWVSPTAQDHSRGTKPPREWDTGIPLSQQVSGLTPHGTNAETEKPGGYRLNPFFSAWLMGYQKAWTLAGLRAVSRLVKRSKAKRRSSGAMATQSCLSLLLNLSER